MFLKWKQLKGDGLSFNRKKLIATLFIVLYSQKKFVSLLLQKNAIFHIIIDMNNEGNKGKRQRITTRKTAGVRRFSEERLEQFEREQASR